MGAKLKADVLGSEYELYLRKTLDELREIADKYQPAVLATAFGPESMVLIDIIAKNKLDIEIASIDTGRLPEQTFELIENTRKRYGLNIRFIYPNSKEVGKWVNENGPNSFYQDVALRKKCCEIRKVHPLRELLSTKKSWITGVRRDQSEHRAGLSKKAWDEANGLIKFNPMLDWPKSSVWAYIKKHRVPYNSLHDKGYPSVGCAPCTRAVSAGESERSGRWWWESDEIKECGLHFNEESGRMVRSSKD